MKYAVLFLALMAWTMPALPAQDWWAEPEPPQEPTEKERLLALLDEQTAIATRTRMNADYVPGMVTVLHGGDLEARGARTVWEALAHVPGVELAIEKTGRRRVMVRGFGNTWAWGTVKILLNDVSMNSADQGLADPVYNMAIEQVDRIEMIRGPGSALYGEYAYLGVINVVTRAEENRVYTFGGSFNTLGAGGNWLFSSPESPVKASLNLAAWRSSGPDAESGEDLLYAYDVGYLSHAPGPANEEADAATGVFTLGYERFSFKAQWTQDGFGDYFGASYYLPADPDRIIERNRHRSVDMRQEIPVTPAMTAGIQLEWKDVERRREHLFVGPRDENPASPPVLLDTYHLETRTSLGTDFTYRGWDKHVVLLAANTSSVRVNNDWAKLNIPFPYPSIPEETTRDITAVTLQDEYRNSDLFTLTAGLRYDEYSDVGVLRSPRIAGVWRLDDHHILKAQYAHAFRPPTLYEIEIAASRGWKEPSPATIRSYELGYVFKGTTAETRFTSFYSQLDDSLIFVSDRVENVYDAESVRAWGAELEQNWRPSPRLKLEGTLSYVDPRENETSHPFSGASAWIANAGAGYRRGKFSGTLQAHHVSNYFREPEDPRSDLGGYTTLDLTGTLDHIVTRGLRLRVGIKNLLDADVRYPAPSISLYPNNPESVSATYPNDYPRPGRNWWAQITYTY